MATDISVCHLTTRDHLMLEAMIEHCRDPETAFDQMLRRKVRNSQLYLREDIPADVAILDCWVTYQIDGHPMRPRQLVEHEQARSGGDLLSVHSLHGLALLGLAEGATAVVEAGNGQVATIQLVKVVQAPQPKPTGDVVSFRARKVLRLDHAWQSDDDPGPTAA